MSKMEHTQGAWDRDGLKVRVFGRGTVAICPTPQDGGTLECSANASLIAALPAMLAALKAVRSRCDGRLGPGRATAINQIADMCDVALSLAGVEVPKAIA